jgi:hypothetical protein
MARLKNRQNQIPNGFKFRQPELKWDSTAVLGTHPSFRTLCQAVYMLRQANKFVAQQKGWAMDLVNIEAEVEAYNVKLCEDHGWNQYLLAEAPPPKSTARPPLSAFVSVAAGAGAIADWLGNGGTPEPKEKAEARAAVCVACPLNERGDWTRFFTKPAATVLKRFLEVKNGMQLATSVDASLGVCSACLCPLPLKVWAPIRHITANTPEEVKKELHPTCWVTHGQ